MRRRRSSVERPRAEINITSLLDITFVLLISFIIVAPAMIRGVDIDLPTVRDAQTLKPNKPITVSVPYHADGKDELRVQGKAIELDGLVDEIRRVAGDDKDRAVTLDADHRVEWDTMARVISELRRGGIANIGILTQTEKKQS